MEGVSVNTLAFSSGKTLRGYDATNRLVLLLRAMRVSSWMDKIVQSEQGVATICWRGRKGEMDILSRSSYVPRYPDWGFLENVTDLLHIWLMVVGRIHGVRWKCSVFESTCLIHCVKLSI